MASYKIRILKVFKTNIWSFYQNILLNMLRRRFCQNEIAKKCQNEYYPGNLYLINFSIRMSLHVLMCPISLLKRNLWSYWKWQNFEKKFAIFMVSKKDTFFLDNMSGYYIC